MEVDKSTNDASEPDQPLPPPGSLDGGSATKHSQQQQQQQQQHHHQLLRPEVTLGSPAPDGMDADVL
jgi:hypothetical protein